jgi:hypothetical protein
MPKELEKQLAGLEAETWPFCGACSDVYLIVKELSPTSKILSCMIDLLLELD